MLASQYGISFDDQGASDISKNLQTVTRLIAEYGDCLSFDYFQPVKDEREAEKLALVRTGYAPLASRILICSFKIYSCVTLEKHLKVHSIEIVWSLIEVKWILIFR